MFLIPMVVAAVTTLVFLCTDAEAKWKVVAVAATGASLAMQFVPALQVHFLVPLILQVIVGICLLTYFKMEYLP